MAASIKDLKSRLKKYRYHDLAARDIATLVTNYKDLKPSTEVKQYIHSNGSTEQLMEITGTIPVNIRGQMYNIPVSIWLRLTHPYHCPIVYVKPTQDMIIQPTRFVDRNGIVYLPYLNEWKQDSSDLTALTQILCASFAEQCPVYSRRAAQQQQHQQHHQQHHQQYPQQWHQQHHQQPAMPPSQPPTGYRYQNQQPNYPPSRPPQQQHMTGHPPYPPAATSGNVNPLHSYNAAPPNASTASHNAPYPTNMPAGGMPMPMPQQHQQHHMPYGASPSPGYPHGSTVGGQPQPPYPSGPPTTGGYPSMTGSVVAGAMLAGSAARSTVVSEEEERKHIQEQERIQRRSMESAVQDKIRRQLLQVLERAKTEMEQLMETQKSLQNGSRKLNEMLQEMELKQREITSQSNELREKNTELESVLEYLRSQPDKVDVDESVVATNKLYNQIMQLYTEENAIDDTIYYLGESLRKGVIPLDVYLKHIRDLSRRQYMARATIMKARGVAKLQQ